MQKFIASIGFAVVAAFAATSASATAIYTSDFEGGPSETTGFSGGSIVSSQGYSAFGFGNYLYQASSTPTSTISFNDSDPSSYTDVTLNLSLAIIDSWDGSCCSVGPDHLTVTVDGTSVFDAVFANYDNTGATVAPGLTALSYGSNLGFNGGYNDAAYTLTLDLGALAPDMVHTFAFTASDPSPGGWQGGSDESLGIDNILLTGTRVATSAVPEPATLAMMMLGLLGLGIAARRQRR